MPLQIPADVRARLDAAAGEHGFRLDSTGLFFERELEHILLQELEEQRAPLVGFTQIPVLFDLPAGAKTFVAQHKRATGRAKRISNWADDLPLVGMERDEERFPIESYGAAAAWSVLDILAAQQAGRGLSGELLTEAREIIERRMHDTLWFGDDDAGLWGVFAHPLIPRRVLTVDIDDAAAPDDILDQLNSLVNDINDRTNGIATGFRMLMPNDRYSLLASTPRSTTSDTTILQYFLQNNPHILDVQPSWPCQGAGTDGVDAIVVFRPRADRICMKGAMPPTPQPAQYENLSVKVPMMARWAGLYVPYPLEMTIAELPT